MGAVCFMEAGCWGVRAGQEQESSLHATQESKIKVHLMPRRRNHLDLNQVMQSEIMFLFARSGSPREKDGVKERNV